MLSETVWPMVEFKVQDFLSVHYYDFFILHIMCNECVDNK